MPWRTTPPHPEARTGWFALFMSVLVAALFTATAIVFMLVGPAHVSAPAIFLFAFAYALLAGIVVGMPVLGRLARRGYLTALTSAAIGAGAACVPALIFVFVMASCDHIPKIGAEAACHNGAWTMTAWGFGAMLVAGLSVTGAAAGVLGYATFRSLKHLLYSRMPEAEPKAG